MDKAYTITVTARHVTGVDKLVLHSSVHYSATELCAHRRKRNVTHSSVTLLLQLALVTRVTPISI